jgi:hypothetical protein
MGGGEGEVEARKRSGTPRRKSSGRASARGKPLDGSSTASSEFAGMHAEREQIEMLGAVKDMLKREKKKGQLIVAHKKQSLEKSTSGSSASSSGSFDARRQPIVARPAVARRPSEKTLRLSTSGGSSRDKDVAPVSEFELQFARADTSQTYKQLKREIAEARAAADRQKGVALPSLASALRRTKNTSNTLLSPTISMTEGDLKTAAPWAQLDGPRPQSLPVTGLPHAIIYSSDRTADPLIAELEIAARGMNAAGARGVQLSELESPPSLTPPLTTREKLTRSKRSAPLNKVVSGVPQLVIERSTSTPDLRVLLARSLKQRRRDERASRRAERAARGEAGGGGAADDRESDSASGLSSVFTMMAKSLVKSAHAGEDGGSDELSSQSSSDHEGSEEPYDAYDEEDELDFSLMELCELKESGIIDEVQFNQLKQRLIAYTTRSTRQNLLVPGDEDY